MSSDLKVENIKHQSSSSNNLVLASDGNVSITNTLSAGTIGSNVAVQDGFGVVDRSSIPYLQCRLPINICRYHQKKRTVEAK